MPTDAINDDPESPQEETVSSKSTSDLAKQNADLLRRISTRDKQFNTLNQTIASLRTELSEKEIVAAQAKLELEGKVTGLQSDLTKKTSELTQTVSERDRLKSAKDAAAVIAEKYPQKPHLINSLLIGDLKLREDFGNDEDYGKYLDRQAKLAPVDVAEEEEVDEEEVEETPPPKKSLKDNLKGYVPGGNTRISGTKKGQRSLIDISDDMMQLSPLDPKYKELQAELQAATIRK